MMELPLGILWFGAVIVAMLDGTRRRNAVLSIVILASALVSTLVLGADVYRNGTQEMVVGGWEQGVGISLRIDTLGIIFAVLSQAVLLAALVFETANGIKARIFPALVLFMGLGLTGVFFTGDAFNFYVFFEIAMISAYVLASYGETPRQFRSAFIFIVVNLLGSMLFLISIAALYHTTGRLDMVGIKAQVPLVAESPIVLISATIFVAFGVKLGLFPFHFWLPAVYTGTRASVVAILSGALANIGSYGLIRFGADVLPRELEFGAPVLLILGAVSIVYGGVQSISRHSANEVLAYSSIGQVGYIMVALAIGGEAGVFAAILYTVINGLNKALLFLAVSMRGWLVGTAFAIGAFSVAGVPPAAGFLGKLVLFQAAIEDGSWAIVVLVLLGGGLSFLYMFQLYRRRFWIAGEEEEESAHLPQVIVVGMAVGLLLIGLWPQPLLELADQAVLGIMGTDTAP
ncbi:MAG: oxidoreductase [Chloroflexia bacterium]|jgi:multicomponent Na+:H+ antiporter subunit D|nr:oxidoreductase [Chloroflexia bacterium]MDQ3613897.1 oxidoreductase [Chloroflexota bacterium]